MAVLPSASSSPALAMVAGEASGDLLAGLLLDGLRQRWPNLRAAGIGGTQMRARGFEAWWPSDLLAVHGYSAELARRLLQLLALRRTLRRRLCAGPAGLFVGVDAPDFNLALEMRLRSAGWRTAHFVCPSIWAWRAHRVEQLRRSADHVLCLFPFEPALLAQHGIAATYVGHPLAQFLAPQPDVAAARRQLGIPEHAKVLALLPGSRRGEVAHLALPFFQAAAKVQQARGAIEIVVPALPSVSDAIVAAARSAGVREPRVVEGQSHAVLAACDVALVASGTATLEAALLGRPMVIAYRVGPIAYRLMRRQQLQPWVGLPNILCRDFVVPELLQEMATPDAMATALLRWLDAPEQEPALLAGLQQRFAALHAELRRDTATIAADALAPLLPR